MRGRIESAPRDGKFVILEEDGGGKFIVGRWSAETRGWVCEDGQPIKITPKYWHPVQGEIYLQQELAALPSVKSTAPPATANDVTTSDSIAPPTTVATVEPPPAPIEVNRSVQKRWRFAAAGMTAGIVAVAFTGLYFQTQITSYVTQYVGRQDTASAINGQVQAKELAEARRTVDELKQSLGQNSDRTAALMQEVNAAREALTTSAAQQRQALDEERARSNALANELTAARRDRDASVVLSNKVADEATRLGKATEARAAELAQERDRSAALGRELAAVRQELQSKMSVSSEAGNEVARLKQAVEAEKASTAELQRSLQQERDKAAVLARDLESAQRVMEARAAVDRPANSQIGQTRPTAAPAAGNRPAPETQGDTEASRLMARARALLVQGNIGAARIVLERAVEMGSAEASFALAETYDPRILSNWGTYGTRGDVAKARELYGKATAGGIREAQDRFNALRQ
jgi:hypothetical protein